MESWRIPLGIASLAIVGLGVLGMLSDRLNRSVPSTYDMRRYRISIMTDDQLRSLRSRAETDAIKYRVAFEQEKKKFSESEGQRAIKCADEVYKLRHDVECMAPLLPISSYASLYAPSADSLFDDYILGLCSSAKTVYEARKWKCMPSE